MNYEKAFENMAKALKLGESVDPANVGGAPDSRPRQVELSVEDSLRCGTIAGKESPRLLDRRDHFPVMTENQAKSAITRSMQLSDVPMWYRGTLENLREEVYLGAIATHPHLRDMNVPVPAEQALALSDGETGSETSTSDVKNPADVRKNDTDSKRPTITTARILAAECQDDERRLVIAGNVLENLEQQKKALETAMKVANRLMKKGLTADEFAGLVSFYQEDILRELLMKGTTASVLDRRDELLARLNKNDQVQ